MASVLGVGEGSLFILASSLCIAEASAEGLPAGPTQHKETITNGAQVQLCYSIQKTCETQQACLLNKNFIIITSQDPTSRKDLLKTMRRHLLLLYHSVLKLQ